MQRDIIEAVNSLRETGADAVKAHKSQGLARQNIAHYGYRQVGELFVPHVSLAYFDRQATGERVVLPELSSFDGQFTQLGLFEMGEYWTCVRPVAVVDLA